MARTRDVCPSCRVHGCVDEGGMWRCPKCGGRYHRISLCMLDADEVEASRQRQREKHRERSKGRTRARGYDCDSKQYRERYRANVKSAARLKPYVRKSADCEVYASRNRFVVVDRAGQALACDLDMDKAARLFAAACIGFRLKGNRPWASVYEEVGQCRKVPLASCKGRDLKVRCGGGFGAAFAKVCEEIADELGRAGK